jgi:hypothetical protein
MILYPGINTFPSSVGTWRHDLFLTNNFMDARVRAFDLPVERPGGRYIRQVKGHHCISFDDC